jgi:hypothetical protein
MAIYRILQHQAFEPELIEVMTAAYEGALKDLGLTDRRDPLTELIAGKIIELAQQGECDPIRIRHLVLAALKPPHG